MAIILDGLSLPVDLIWKDVHGWSNVVQSVKKSLTGALIIQEASQAKGRLITLSGDQTSAWITKSTLDTLMLKVNTPDKVMVLDFHGTIYNVIFIRSGNKSPIISKEIYELANPDSEHIYSFVLRLMEV